MRSNMKKYSPFILLMYLSQSRQSPALTIYSDVIKCCVINITMSNSDKQRNNDALQQRINQIR
jgi:hypothetical protein